MPWMEGLLLLRKAGSMGQGAAGIKEADKPPVPRDYHSLPTAVAAKSCPTPAGVAESSPQDI